MGAVLEPLFSAAQARAADAYTIEELGVPGLVLMEHAGRAVAHHARGMVSPLARALVLAGPGNNGGDGWVCARHLWASGVPCPVVSLKAPDQLTGDASQVAQLFLTAAEARAWTADAFAGPSFLIDLADNLMQLVDAFRPDLIVDALFGTGLTRPLDALAARVVEQLAGVRVPILAVDVPSGLPADGAAPTGPVVRAHKTVTFGSRKIAHVSEPGRFSCGDVVVEDIAIMSADNAPPAAWRLVSARSLIPVSSPTAHKGRFGHVGVVVGEHTGASRLAARAALRAGAGLASVLDDDTSVKPSLDAEIMRHSRSTDVDALVIGPGCGNRRDVNRAMLVRAKEKGVPCVVDAEAIDELVAARVNVKCVVTPHPGEAARVLGTTTADVQSDRIAAARALVGKLPPAAAVVLKGACPIVVVDTGQRVIIVEGGNPSLAIAGSGDVLAGTIGALLGRGMSPAEAALLGVELHQRAGALLPSRGALASELADAIGRALAS